MNIDQTPSEILLPIFKKLNSVEMLTAMRVRKDWMTLIDDHSSLWRHLILPDKWGGWDPEIVELFDRKSQSTLKEVVMKLNVSSLRRWNPASLDNHPLITLLERSKTTLQTVILNSSDRHFNMCLSGLPWKIPNLVDCRIYQDTLGLRPVCLVKTSITTTTSSLKILWIGSPRLLLKPKRAFLDHLVSLKVRESLWSKKWRKILEVPSETLKHLSISIGDDDQEEATLKFPKLELTEIQPLHRFPSWMEIPRPSTIILREGPLRVLPAISSIWFIGGLFKGSETALPYLEELRINFGGEWSFGDESLFRSLSLTLLERKRNVNDGMEIDGVRFLHLKRLYVRFESESSEFINQLKDLDLAEEVIQLNDHSNRIEIEV